MKKAKNSKQSNSKSTISSPPKLANRRDNSRSSFKKGRTIGEQRERLETANERAAARKKDKKRQTLRVVFTILGFLALTIILVFLCFIFVNKEQTPLQEAQIETSSVNPTIEIVDEDTTAGGRITNRMKTYIGQAEGDFRDLGYTLVKAAIPINSIREVDFYLEGYPGFIKTVIDRNAAVSVEDADRMLRYLADQGITEFTYIDVRIDGKAFWK